MPQEELRYAEPERARLGPDLRPGEPRVLLEEVERRRAGAVGHADIPSLDPFLSPQESEGRVLLEVSLAKLDRQGRASHA